MRDLPVRRYRVSRWLGRFVTHLAAAVTLGRMPPFVSTSAIVVVDDRLLMVVDPIRNEPVLPGGHLKWRESPVGAVIREVREETGYDVAPRALVGVFAGQEWAGEPGVVRVVFEGVIEGGALQGSAEGDAVWLPLEELRVSETRDAPVIRAWLGRAGDSAT